MSGGFRKIGAYLGLLEETGQHEAYDADETTTHQAVDARPESRPAARERRPSPAGQTSVVTPVADLAERRRPTPVPNAEEASDVTRIITLHPSTYNEARTVGEHFRAGTPVIMNLTEMDDSDAKRLVDFAAGLVFATRGTIERVTAKVFLLSPPNVQVTAEEKERIAEGGFFNQS